MTSPSLRGAADRRLLLVLLALGGLLVAPLLVPSSRPRGGSGLEAGETAGEEAAAGSGGGEADRAGSRPNIVLIISDDQGWGDFGFQGHPVIRTPHLDQLAAESAVFPNGYVPTSLCRASLASILTGLQARQHRICCNDPPEGVDREAMIPFLRDATTIPGALGKLGYRSLQTGKFWEGHYSNGGFTHGMTLNKVKGRHGDEGLDIGRKTLQPIYDFIEEGGKQPFFVWYAPMMPHEPHDPPERILAKYRAPDRDERLARYWAMCEWFDETCGELLGYLDAKGLRENTLVAFVVDNGWIQPVGTSRRGEPPFGPKSKLSPYDGGLRTPLLLRWPGHTKAGRHDDLVSTLDLFPTVLAALGQPRLEQPQLEQPRLEQPRLEQPRLEQPRLEQPRLEQPRLEQPIAALLKRLPGLSLLEVAAGKGSLARKAVYGEIYVHTAIDLSRIDLNVTHRWVREGAWKCIVPLTVPVGAGAAAGVELYNVVDDPTEEDDLAASRPELALRLRSLTEAWAKESSIQRAVGG